MGQSIIHLIILLALAVSPLIDPNFETNEDWKNNLINLKQEPDWLLHKLPPQSVLMIKKSRFRKTTLEFPSDQLKNQKELYGWVLFY